MLWHRDVVFGNLSGRLTVTAHRGGQVDLTGRLRGDAPVDFVLRVLLVADADAGAVSFTVEGAACGADGTFHQSCTDPTVRTFYPAFERGTVRVSDTAGIVG